MSDKSKKISDLVAQASEQGLNPHYAGYFHCFNRALFFEAHEVLEVLWLNDRRGPEGAFYKGLIQLAGAFVHLQKLRLGPAAALFRLARSNLGGYPKHHHRLDVAKTIEMIDHWQRFLAASGDAAPHVVAQPAPKLELLARARGELRRHHAGLSRVVE